jgi:hypothetical protein
MQATAWALDQVKARLPGAAVMVGPSVQNLVDAILVLRGRRTDVQVFGMDLAWLELDGRPMVEDATIAALMAWKAYFEERDDVVSLLELDRAGRAADLGGLRLTRRFPLRCDPLGSSDGVSGDWLRRIEAAKELGNRRRRPQPSAIHYVGGSDREPVVTVGAPDMAALYAFVLRYEASARRSFPREIAALYSAVDGIALDDDLVLVSITQWRTEDRGWCIGCGGYSQGTLTIEITKKKGLLEAPLVDRDDDGVVRARYRDFGTFLDALLGLQQPG